MQPIVQSWLSCVTQQICEEYEVESICWSRTEVPRNLNQIKNQNGSWRVERDHQFFFASVVYLNKW